MENSSKNTSHTLLIREYILSLIEQKKISQQSKLPAERMLCERFGITRITLRQALVQLETEGFIYREHHKGWFVSPARILYDPTQNMSFTEMVLKQNRQPSNKILSAEKHLATPWTRESLKLKEDENEVYCIRRLRSVDDRPVMVEHLYINAARCENLLDGPIETSLTEILNSQYNIVITRSSVRLHSTALTDVQAKDLNGAAGTPSIYLIRTNYDQDDNIIEVDQEFWRHDALELTASSQLEAKAKQDHGSVSFPSQLSGEERQLIECYQQQLGLMAKELALYRTAYQQELCEIKKRLKNLEANK